MDLALVLRRPSIIGKRHANILEELRHLKVTGPG